LWLLLVGVALVWAQEDTAEPPGTEAADGGDGAGDGGDGEAAGGEEVEEAWQYVEFLKKDVIDKIENILQETLYTAKEKNSLDQTVQQTMDQVMEVREAILLRIKGVRKGEIQLDPTQNVDQEKMLSELRMEIMTILLKLVDKDAASVDKLKEISDDLLKFKMTTNAEIMRILMLPQNLGRTTPPPAIGCSQCDALKEIEKKIKKLVECAEGKSENDQDENDEDDAEGDDAGDADGEDAADGADAGEGQCPEPRMYFMSLIVINEDIDNEISELYNKLIGTTDDAKRETSREDLDYYKDVRDKVDDLITKLMVLDDDEKMKKTVKRELGRIASDLKRKLQNCLAACGGPEGCSQQCASEVIDEILVKMKDYKLSFENFENEEEKSEFVRSGMIKYINDINGKDRELLIKKANENSLDECGTEQRKAYQMIKGPSWMLVNTTIFAKTELEAMVDAMIKELTEKYEQACGSPAETVRDELPDEGPNCQWDEYQQTKEYLTKVDEIIQDSLFKVKDDSAQMNALLGFVDIQGEFDKRVKKLFEEELICPDEATFIKKNYMDQLGKCMAEFMNGKLKFSQMSRLQRIGCIKELRTMMESRMGELLKAELESSLNGIEAGDDSGDAVVEA